MLLLGKKPIETKADRLRSHRTAILYLENNELSGQIPDDLFNLSTLRFLRLTNNTALNGTLSENISSMSSIRDIDLVGTALGGVLPSGLFDLIDLQKLRLSHNSFTGPLSESFGKLVNTTQIQLNNNMFTGTIPMAFETLPKLSKSLFFEMLVFCTDFDDWLNESLSRSGELELHSNNITGSVSDALCARTGDGFFDLTYLTADCNGTNPEVICACCDYCPPAE